jgi:Ras GTPase-activating-like protein IQGAP2/3
MLQNLANKPSYAKEAYMMTLNPFVENNKARINQFLNNLCEVGDFYETLEVCSISYVAPDDYSKRFADGPIHGAVQKGLDDPYLS